MSDFLNPYNFVRWLEPPTPQTPEQHLLWRCPPPPHDRYIGLSGRIRCTLTTKTPLFVSEGQPVEHDKEKDHSTYAFLEVDGQPVIPGTGLRGAIRSVFEAVTNSRLGVFDGETPLTYRMSPGSALGLVPGRVEKDSQGNWTLRLLTGHKKIRDRETYAAWIPRYPNGNILKKSDTRKHRHYVSKNTRTAIPKDCGKDGEPCFAAVSQVRNRGFPHYEAHFIHSNRAEVEKVANQYDAEVLEGYVYRTGLNADVKQYERFFYVKGKPQFAAFERHQDGSYLAFTAYNQLLADYHKRQEEIKNSLTSQSKDSGRKLEPSHFIKSKQPWSIDVGSLVYAKLKQRGKHHVVEALYPVNISRATYDTPPGVLLPEAFHPPKRMDTLGMASRVFGWVSQDADERREERVAYKGRVSFSHATFVDGERLPDMTLSILGTPHPTAVAFYLENSLSKQVAEAKRQDKHGYDTPDENLRLRGRKFYRHHPVWTKQEATTTDKSNQNRTIRGAFDANSKFTFTVDFENFHPLELGALLWTLRLQEGDWRGYHRVGYGKPLGLGSVQITVDDLQLFDVDHRYLNADFITQDDTAPLSAHEQADRYIEEFTNAFLALYAPTYGVSSFRTLPNISDLCVLLGEKGDNLPIHYPRPQRSGDNDNEGFRWFAESTEELSPTQHDKGLRYLNRRK